MWLIEHQEITPSVNGRARLGCSEVHLANSKLTTTGAEHASLDIVHNLHKVLH